MKSEMLKMKNCRTHRNQSILAKAFLGVLVSQDLNDGPASEFLDRFRAAREQIKGTSKKTASKKADPKKKAVA